MPILTINTNVPQDKITVGLCNKLAAVVASCTGKPLNYIVVHVSGSQVMSFGGGEDPCAIGRLSSIGAITKEGNKNLQIAIVKELSSLGIKGDHVYVTFEDVPAANIGWKDTTFGYIFG